jgi:hypothetical protein
LWEGFQCAIDQLFLQNLSRNRHLLWGFLVAAEPIAEKEFFFLIFKNKFNKTFNKIKFFFYFLLLILQKIE